MSVNHNARCSVGIVKSEWGYRWVVRLKDGGTIVCISQKVYGSRKNAHKAMKAASKAMKAASKAMSRLASEAQLNKLYKERKSKRDVAS